MPWEQNRLNQQGQDQDEHGRVCQFEVENIHATQWQFDESFSCGNSTKRIVMCQKAFEVFEKVGKNSQLSSIRTIWKNFLSFQLKGVHLIIFVSNIFPNSYLIQKCIHNQQLF